MIRAIGRRYPGTTAGLIVTAFAAVLILPYLFWGQQDLTEGTGVVTFDTLTSGLVWQAILSACLLLIIWILGWYDIAGLRGPVDRRGLRAAVWLGGFPLLGFLGFAIALLRFGAADNPYQMITIVLCLNLMVGLSEELLFRGILFGGLRQRHRLVTAIIVSSIAFGMLHLANLGIGQSLQLTIFQVVNAAALGTLFCAVTLQANSVWPAILLHMFWNSYVMLGQAVSEASASPDLSNIGTTPTLGISALILPALLLIISIWMLIRYVRRTGQSLWIVAPTPAQRSAIHA